MGSKMTSKAAIAREACETWKEQDTRWIAKWLVAHYGELYDFNIELARTHIRRWRGAVGKRIRQQIGDRIIPKLPKSQTLIQEPFNLPAGKWLLLFDIHVPYHDEKAVKSAIEYGKTHGATGFILQDAQDCESCSSFARAEDKRDFSKEIFTMLQFLNWLDYEFPNAMKVWQESNHEERLPNYYLKNAVEMAGMPCADLASVLGLEKRGYEWVGDRRMIYAGKYLTILHGHELLGASTTVNPARGVFLKAIDITVVGHWHMTSQNPAKTIRGKELPGFSVGCLCGLKPKYLRVNKWNHGFGWLELDEKGDFDFQNLRILPSGKVVRS